jgi:hypothetical protein
LRLGVRAGIGVKVRVRGRPWPAAPPPARPWLSRGPRSAPGWVRVGVGVRVRVRVRVRVGVRVV